MEDQEKNENVKQPASPQPAVPAVPAVKSRAAEVQATVDRNLAEREARQKITDELIAKRKQTAALEAKAALDQAAEVTSAEQQAAARAAWPENAPPIVMPGVEAIIEKAVTSSEQRAETGPGLAKGKADDIVDSKTAEADALEKAAAVTSSNQRAEAIFKAAATSTKQENDVVIAEADMTPEMRQELEKQIEDKRASGVPMDDAEYEAKRTMAEILDDVMKKSNARELREIEMHNAQMDSVNSLVTILSVISNNIREVAEVLDLIRLRQFLP